jgi:hypothetical protein
LAAVAAGGNRIAESAEFVDQAALLGLLAAPHAAARDRIDFLRRLVARSGYAADETPIALIDDALDHLADFRIELAAHVERTGEFRRADAVGMHADLGQGVRYAHEQAEDADRAGNRRRLGENLVAVHRYPVAAPTRRRRPSRR